MTALYLKTNSTLIKEIITIAVKSSSGKDTQELESFIRYFYEFSAADKLKAYSVQELAQLVLEAFSFLKKRPKGKPSMRIYNTTRQEKKWEKPYTVVELVNDDMPFLVDSLSEALNRQGLAIEYMTHPVIEAVRDSKGTLKQLSPALKKNHATDKESFIHFHVTHIPDVKTHEKLKDQLVHVLSAVKVSVDDWQQITKNIADVKEHLLDMCPALDKAVKAKATELFKDDIAEITEFLTWLENDNFVFLGFIEQKLKNDKMHTVKASGLGLFKHEQLWLPHIKQTKVTPEHVLELIHITKSSEKSIVHRSAHMDLISVLKTDKKGKVIGAYHILGMFTSAVYYQSARRIPLLHRKIDRIVQKSGFSPGGHSGKTLIAIIEDLPRDELFQASVDELFEIAMEIVTLTSAPRVRLFYRTDESERFVSCLIFLPRDRMTTVLRHKFEAILAEAFNGTISNHYTQIAESHLARLQIIIKTTPGKIPTISGTQIEDTLQRAASLWNDALFEELEKRHGSKEGAEIYNAFKDAFSLSYTNRFSAQDAYYDIKKVNYVIAQSDIAFDLYESSSEENKDVFHLKIYSPKAQVTLSKVMPMLENIGFYTIDEHTYQIRPKQVEYDIWIHRFRFRVALGTKPHLKDIKKNFEDAMLCLWRGEIQNDGLNKLIVFAGFNWREVALLRAYIKYLQQARFTYTQNYIEEALGCHPRIVKNLVELFFARFDPAIKGREKRCSELEHEIDRLLSQVSNLAEDKIIRALLCLVQATWRTNYFQKDAQGEYKTYLSFKFNSAQIPFLPKPRPYTEIYVYSARMAGIHLRGGKVARGGLRWSDRREDFRTEVLGLMKAQMTKNSVIIPVGSKGGFVVKQMPGEGGREAMLQEGIACYKTFLRGLLDITDNLVNNKVVTPKDVIRYDGDDPYLVVAADKGTATFSDIANAVAEEYDFWLGDAFASGGSQGYDHKKMGITAKGAWISVQRHFKEMGVDVQKDPITVVGIGDMSGDVFGNGMLRSQAIKLVAAFNHMHIFVDPNPDMKLSFKERQRLFNLPRSTWLDYDAKLISKGGGVFDRTAKSLKVTPQMKALFNIGTDTTTPDELIKSILCAPVDLLWNGGIGTYVKSKTEGHEQVGDKTNDAVRVNGKDLQVKVIGEGGNLGFTQLGRIEFASNGGRINTDAVDNSAGVDCSDHEVNIKIALNHAVSTKALLAAQRNKLLEEMTDDVSELVLRDNHLQTQFLTIAQTQGHALLDGHARAIATLESEGLLDREIEFLPNKEEIARRHAQNKGLTRPELSVIMAYSKIALYDELLKSKLPSDAYYNKDLELYFPQKLQKRFQKEIHHHPLRREIVATSVTNSIVNRLGIEIFVLLKESTGMDGCDIARAYTIVRDVFGLRQLWSDIEAVGDKISVQIQVELFLEIRNLVERSIFWLLKRFHHLNDLTKIVDYFGEGIQALYDCIPNVLANDGMTLFEEQRKHYKQQHVPEELAEQMAGLGAMQAGFNIVHVSKESKCKIHDVAKAYYGLGEVLHLDWLLGKLEALHAASYWQKTSMKTLMNDILAEQERLTIGLMKHVPAKGKCDMLTIQTWSQIHQKQIDRYIQFMQDIKNQDDIDFSMILVAIGKIKEIAS